MTTTGSQPPSSWRDDFSSSQHPKVTPVDDLTRFVMARIMDAEDAPQFDVPQAYYKPAGPIAHRYAAEMRRDMIVFRRIVELYVEAHGEDNQYEGYGEGARRYTEAAVLVLANRFADHPDFRDEWRLE